MKNYTFKLNKVKESSLPLIEEVLSRHGEDWQRSGDGDNVNLFTWKEKPLLEYQGECLYVHVSPSTRALLKGILITLDRNAATRFPSPPQWAVAFVVGTLFFLVRFLGIATSSKDFLLLYAVFGLSGVLMSAGMILGSRATQRGWRWLFVTAWISLASLSALGLYAMSRGGEGAWLLFLVPALVGGIGWFAYRDLVAWHYVKWIFAGEGLSREYDSGEAYRPAELSRDEVAKKNLINSVIFLVVATLSLLSGEKLMAFFAMFMAVGSFVVGTVMGQQKDES
ncbi:hypothetical protein [Alcanivorax sp. 24]|uniref:hypothetical protein n=1 Tax=Alcanivorax sp. 24 TaxID=2545266 RepID=UPI001061E309|nr:hypothetical protein [Alcanivorax sp. 24]